MRRFFLKSWPFFAIAVFVLIFFWKVLLQGQAPIPGDFIVGTYFPWLDYKWGYQVGVPVKNPITSDVVSIIYPLRSYAVDILKTGHIPLWNPLMLSGSPLFADFQVGILSPTIVFYFLLPKIWAWTTQVMLQPFLAAVFMYLLLRNFKLGKVESVFGGIFYAFAGFNVIWMEWNNSTLVAAFIPLLILLTDKFIKTGLWYWMVGLAVTICLQIFSGYPQLVIYTLISLFIFLIFRRKEITNKKLVIFFLFILFGILLSSVLLIPGVEFILNSQRKFEVLERELIYLPWQNLITFLAPDYFGNPATKNYFGVGNYTLNAGYSGVIAFTLAIVAVLKSWKKPEVKYFVTLILLSLLFALPTPFAWALFNSHIPAISASSMTRILILSNLSIAVLAAFGIAHLEKEKIKKIGFIFLPSLALIGITAVTFIAKINLEITLRNLVLPIGLSAISVVLILLRKRFFIIALCLIAVLELFRYGWKYTPFSSPNLVFPETPVLTFFRGDTSIYRVSTGDTIPMNMWVPFRLESVSGYDAVFPFWYAKFINIAGGGDSANNSFSYYAPFYLYNSRWFDVLNNKYLLANIDNKSLIKEISDDAKFEKVFQDKSVAIYRNNNFLPRAFITSSLIGDSLNTPDVVEGSSVVYEVYSPERSLINIKSGKAGYLFVSDTWYPGWSAKVNGQDVLIYRANYAFRAVAVPGGVHKVEFIYKPKSLMVGEWMSAIALIFLVGALFYDLKVHEKVFSK